MRYSPMHASNGDESFLEKHGYIFEPKLDGIRAIFFKDGQKIRILSRNNIDITREYPEFDFVDNIRAKSCVLDGEIVVYDENGNPSFQSWQQRKSGEDLIANYVVFDILEKDGKDLMGLGLAKRKEILEETVMPSARLQTVIFTKEGKKLWKAMEKRRLEGVIAKKEDSLYEPGKRSNNWVKIKFQKTADAVILGYTVEKRALTSLALGIYQDGKLAFSGKVGTGFDENSIKKLRAMLEKIKASDAKTKLPKEVIAVKPIYVVEIRYQNITQDKKFRAPVFLRLRDDKSIRDLL